MKLSLFLIEFSLSFSEEIILAVPRGVYEFRLVPFSEREAYLDRFVCGMYALNDILVLVLR